MAAGYVIRTADIGVADDFELGAVVMLEDGRQQVADGVLAEIRGSEAHAQTPVRDLFVEECSCGAGEGYRDGGVPLIVRGTDLWWGHFLKSIHRQQKVVPDSGVVGRL